MYIAAVKYSGFGINNSDIKGVTASFLPNATYKKSRWNVIIKYAFTRQKLSNFGKKPLKYDKCALLQWNKNRLLKFK